ncbi:hypothetical protein BGX38DRAFT_59147 [Terfezia claveryi]|nr:hypothetical protein BGX38DRAFT_59147 [Terfezia claveryi]
MDSTQLDSTQLPYVRFYLLTAFNWTALNCPPCDSIYGQHSIGHIQLDSAQLPSVRFHLLTAFNWATLNCPPYDFIYRQHSIGQHSIALRTIPSTDSIQLGNTQLPSVRFHLRTALNWTALNCPPYDSIYRRHSISDSIYGEHSIALRTIPSTDSIQLPAVRVYQQTADSCLKQITELPAELLPYAVPTTANLPKALSRQCSNEPCIPPAVR